MRKTFSFFQVLNGRSAQLLSKTVWEANVCFTSINQGIYLLALCLFEISTFALPETAPSVSHNFWTIMTWLEKNHLIRHGWIVCHSLGHSRGFSILNTDLQIALSVQLHVVRVGPCLEGQNRIPLRHLDLNAAGRISIPLLKKYSQVICIHIQLNILGWIILHISFLFSRWRRTTTTSGQSRLCLSGQGKDQWV